MLVFCVQCSFLPYTLCFIFFSTFTPHFPLLPPVFSELAQLVARIHTSSAGWSMKSNVQKGKSQEKKPTYTYYVSHTYTLTKKPNSKLSTTIAPWNTQYFFHNICCCCYYSYSYPMLRKNTSNTTTKKAIVLFYVFAIE